MFTNNHVTFVKGSAIKTARDGGTQVTASTSSAIMPSLSATAFASSQYNYWFSGLLPSTPDLPDTTALAYFYRDIYLTDNTAGSCVDIMSVFPFSDWELRGLEDKQLSVFEHAVNRLNLRELLPQLSTAYLTDGFYAGSLVYDARAKNFMDILTHDALQCNITPSPFNNIDPSIRVTTSGPTAQFLNSTSDYAKEYLKSMPAGFIQLLMEGAFTLDPVTTLFVGRRALTDRAYQSYLHRVLPMYLIEKSMYRGTLTEAGRRQRAMSHITAGDDLWTPTTEELRILASQFQQTENDPMGGWITTRNAVSVQDIRPGGDFWKWNEMSDSLVPMKLRALGISEALLSGDASYAAAESAYSTFLETTNAFRSHLTNCIFYKKLFPLVAISNGMFQKDSGPKANKIRPADFLYNMTNREKLVQPKIHWHKDLTGKAEDNMMDLLEKLTEHNVPIPLKMWLAAAGVDKDTLVRDAQHDAALRKELKMHGAQSDQDMDVEAEETNDELTSASVNSGLAGYRKSILDREFPEEVIEYGRTGKPKYKFNATATKRDRNWQIAKIAANFAKDPGYRDALRKENSRRGIETLQGVI